MIDFARARQNMVDGQIRPNGVTDRRLINALREVPRERFVPASLRGLAYIDEDLVVKDASDEAPARYLMEPMAFAQLVQLAEISAEDLVLDVGCATGYSTAVLARLAESAVGLENDEALAAAAEATLADVGADNAAVVVGPLTGGYPGQGPYDVIVLEGAVEEIPQALFDQLRERGRLVAVVSNGVVSRARLYRRIDGDVSWRAAFNLNVRPLPGFQRPPAFVF